VVLGGLAFLGHRALYGAPQSEAIAPKDAPIEQIRQDWLAAKGVLPSADQEAELIDEWVEDEALYRRALELGLDQNDTIVRRRLAQRMRFLLEDTSRIGAPSDAELRAWLQGHSAAFALPVQTTFEQLFFSRGNRGETLDDDARAALEVLRRDARSPVDGDPFFRGSTFEGYTPAGIQRAFGREFADAIDDVPLGQWWGPLTSSYGLHLVYVSHRSSAVVPELDAIRKDVERDWLENERARRNAEALAKLRSRYAPEGSE